MSDTEDNTDQDSMADEWAAALEEQGDTEGEAAAEGEAGAGGEAAAEGEAAGGKPDAGGQSGALPTGKPMPLDEFQKSSSGEPVTAETLAAGGPKLDVILDIPVRLSMEVGNTEISIRNLLQLNQGSVIELDRLAGEPLDVLVNGTLIAHGEVVVVNEKFGIRLTDVISPTERIKRLQ